MYHASGVAQRTTQESPTEKVNKFPSLETQPFEGQVMVEQRYYDIILSFIWLVVFTPRQNEGYCQIQQLHIAEGSRRSYNGSGLQILS